MTAGNYQVIGTAMIMCVRSLISMASSSEKRTVFDRMYSIYMISKRL